MLEGKTEKITDEGLLNALKIIKRVCITSGSCETCPMLTVEGACGVRTTQPSEWLLQPITQRFKVKF